MKFDLYLYTSANTKCGRQDTDFKVCITCQKCRSSSGLLVDPSSESYPKYLNFDSRLGHYNVADFSAGSHMLDRMAYVELTELKASFTILVTGN